LPIEHASRVSQLVPSARAELERYKLAARQYYASLTPPRAALFFDRQMSLARLSHMHIECVPVPLDAVAGAEAHFKAQAANV
jgi:hypothetical protein